MHNDRFLCHSYDHPHILAGQGTCGLEIIEDVPDVDAVVIPVGGGGLIAGIAVAIKSLNSDIQIIVSISLLSNFVIASIIKTHSRE